MLNNKELEIFEELVIPLLNINNKFILTGSHSLKLLNLTTRDVGDIDIGLTKPLTIDEFMIVRDFFGLITTYEERLNYMTSSVVGTDDLKTETYSLENELRNDLIQFIKSRDDDKPRIKIDIFNRQYYNPEDILIYKYKDTFLRILDPSQTIAAKAKYAFDRRLHTSTQQKHSKDISGFLKLDGMFFHNMATNPNIVNLHSNMIEHGSLIKISNNDLPY